MSRSTADFASSKSAVERDPDGRVIHAMLDSAHALPANADGWLAAVDGSACSLRAIAQAAQFARRNPECVLHMISVHSWLSKEAAEKELLTRTLHLTADARGLLDAAGIPWRLHATMGDPSERIVELANRLTCSGIVMGSHGLGVAQSVLLGSVAYRVIHLSRLSVLVVR